MNKKIKAIIVEDNKAAAKDLKRLLLKYSHIEVVNNVPEYVEEAIALIEQEKPDIVFLDIELRDGEGFEILDKITDKKINFIITTGYSDIIPHYNKAYHYDAIHYLIKPIIPEKLKEAIERYSERRNRISPNDERFVIDAKGGKRFFVKISEIIICQEYELKKGISDFLRKNGLGTLFYLSEERKIESIHPFDSFKEKLASLFDTGEQCYLNESFIEKMNDETYSVTMKSIGDIVLAPEKYFELKKLTQQI
jgi:DNA-binding NarL/FixJ family response regulator